MPEVSAQFRSVGVLRRGGGGRRRLDAVARGGLGGGLRGVRGCEGRRRTVALAPDLRLPVGVEALLGAVLDLLQHQLTVVAARRRTGIWRPRPNHPAHLTDTRNETKYCILPV